MSLVLVLRLFQDKHSRLHHRIIGRIPRLNRQRKVIALTLCFLRHEVESELSCVLRKDVRKVHCEILTGSEAHSTAICNSILEVL